jgi:hypothetical protein
MESQRELQMELHGKPKPNPNNRSHATKKESRRIIKIKSGPFFSPSY